MLLLQQLERESVTDKVTVWTVTIQSAFTRKSHLLVKIEIVLRLKEKTGIRSLVQNTRQEIVKSLCLQKTALSCDGGGEIPYCDCMMWNLHELLADIKEFVASQSSGSVSLQWECKTEMAHWHFWLRATSLGEWKATRGTSLLYESEMIPLYRSLR